MIVLYEEGGSLLRQRKSNDAIFYVLHQAGKKGCSPLSLQTQEAIQ